VPLWVETGILGEQGIEVMTDRYEQALEYIFCAFSHVEVWVVPSLDHPCDGMPLK
jgi:hypothetical protein